MAGVHTRLRKKRPKTTQKPSDLVFQNVDLVDCATNISQNTADHRRVVKRNLETCAQIKRDLKEVTAEGDIDEIRMKIVQLKQLLQSIEQQYQPLLDNALKLEAAVSLYKTSVHQHALDVARGDTESASLEYDGLALMSSVHRR